MRDLPAFQAAATNAIALRLFSAAGWLPALRLWLRARAGLFSAGHLGRELWHRRGAGAADFAAAGMAASAESVAIHLVRFRADAAVEHAAGAACQVAVPGHGPLF